MSPLEIRATTLAVRAFVVERKASGELAQAPSK